MDTDYHRRLVEDRAPNIEIRTCKSIVEGWDSHVLEVNGELIFRFPRWPSAAQNVEKEIALLPLLAAALPVQVPKFDLVVRDRPDGPVVFTGYDMIQGEPLSEAVLQSPSKRRSLARDIGELLTALHRMAFEGLEKANVNPVTADGWRQQYRDLFDRAQRDVFPLLSDDAKRAESAVWQEFLASDDNFRFAPVLLHADLFALHILCDDDKGTVVGIIDWAESQIGDPALDITGLLRDIGEEFTLEVLDFYAGNSDQGLMSRARFYAQLLPNDQVWFGQTHGVTDLVRTGLDDIETNARIK
ncbi:MAG: phosphotransferase [SAR202 cluster bacterium]|jgi:aminoglycoside 2''-phosphotransferase|nr:phosphotransferase [SAR202 cluster bacterium]MDP6798746.1 phosphotransferase [SAR202 cluster bacterium]